ncbi:MAG: beta-ketoacyl synthase N-terminal-like domain-containing protein [Nitrospirae bacterium]|nr:beta-ketoacyl synthase N-terminal-like domain-containing protein [Nitrospirota bacterium]
MRKVVVTGMGTVSSLGNSLYESWTAVQRGLSGIDSLTRFDVHQMKWKVAGELKGFDAGLYLSQKEITHLDPFVQYAVAASFMAAEDAGLLKPSEKNKVLSLASGGAIIGSSRGGITTIEKAIIKQGKSGCRMQDAGCEMHLTFCILVSGNQCPCPKFLL